MAQSLCSAEALMVVSSGASSRPQVVGTRLFCDEEEVPFQSAPTTYTETLVLFRPEGVARHTAKPNQWLYRPIILSDWLGEKENKKALTL